MLRKRGLKLSMEQAKTLLLQLLNQIKIEDGIIEDLHFSTLKNVVFAYSTEDTFLTGCLTGDLHLELNKEHNERGLTSYRTIAKFILTSGKEISMTFLFSEDKELNVYFS